MQAKEQTKLTAILRIIRKLERGPISTLQLAREFGLNVRTIQRYINDISNAGFPIYSVGNGGYSFIEGFSLKSAYTTDSEATMLVLLSAITKNLGKNFENSFDSIRKKVMCPNTDSPFYIKMPKTAGYPKTNITDCLEEAVAEHKIITIKYKAKDTSNKEYAVNPYKIVNYEGFWYLYATKDVAKRTFKLENITGCTDTGKYFIPKKDILKHLDESTNIWFGLDKKVKVRLAVDKEVAHFFKAKEYFPKQKIIKTQKDGKLILEATIGDFEEISHTIFSWIPFIKVVSPSDLKNYILNKISKFTKK